MKNSLPNWCKKCSEQIDKKKAEIARIEIPIFLSLLFPLLARIYKPPFLYRYFIPPQAWRYGRFAAIGCLERIKVFPTKHGRIIILVLLSRLIFGYKIWKNCVSKILLRNFKPHYFFSVFSQILLGIVWTPIWALRLVGLHILMTALAETRLMMSSHRILLYGAPCSDDVLCL